MTTNANSFDAQGHTQYTRAVQIWQVLVAAARQGRILTYSALSREMGLTESPLPVVGMGALPLIGQYCTANGLPQLTRIVVGQVDGLPSRYAPEEVLAEDLWRVFDYNWLDVIPPTAQDFERVSG